MPTVRLTKRTVAELIPAVATEFYWDNGLPGFGLRVSPGGTKSYVVQYREATRTKRRTIGNSDVLALDRARNLAKDILAAARLGEALPIKGRDGPLFGEVLDKFIGFVKAKRAARTASDYQDKIAKYMRPVFGSKRINRIERAEIESWHEGMAATPRTANYVLAILVAAFSYAVRMRIIADSEHPARGIPKYTENKRSTYLSLEQIQRFGSALAELEQARKVSPWAAAALRLLIMTGARSGEILALRWEQVDFNRSVLDLPTSKTGAKKVKLSGAAVQILKNIPRIDGVPWVIAGRRHGERMTSLQKPFMTVCQLALISGVRIHDLRHSAASIATSAGIGLPVVGALLGQSQAWTTARYSHIHDAAERHAAEVIADQVGPLLNVGSLSDR